MGTWTGMVFTARLFTLEVSGTFRLSSGGGVGPVSLQ